VDDDTYVLSDGGVSLPARRCGERQIGRGSRSLMRHPSTTRSPVRA
jgi:hypothetical protein